MYSMTISLKKKNGVLIVYNTNTMYLLGALALSEYMFLHIFVAFKFPLYDFFVCFIYKMQTGSTLACASPRQIEWDLTWTRNRESGIWAEQE